MSSIKAYIIEEHNEAFPLWYKAFQDGKLPSSGIPLLHVDEHSDMGTPLLNQSIKTLSKRDDAWEFMLNNLSISNFIVPLIYLGLFDEMVWIRNNHRKNQNYQAEMYVRSFNDDGFKFSMGKVDDLVRNGIPYQNDKGLKKYKYTLQHTSDHLELRKGVALDIDLDYFSCIGDPNIFYETRIEISKSEFESFVNDPYHPLRFKSARFDVLQEDGKYFYIMNQYKYKVREDCFVEESEIEKRIEVMIRFLSENEVEPSMLTICRSRFSGYTPPNQWSFIEDNLIDKLRKLYSLDISIISDLMMNGSKLIVQ
jgi:hypothetical protein